MVMRKLRTQMRWIMLAIVVAFLLSTFLMYEGRGTRRGPRPSSNGAMEDYEVAQVNGRPLMRSELEQRLRNYLENYGQRGTASLDMPALYKSLLDQYAFELQLAQEVRDRGIQVTDAEAEQAMKEYADQAFPTREAFYQSLERSGIKVEDYKKGIARQMANEQLMRTAVGEVVVSEDEAVRFYDTMKELFYRQPEGFKVHLARFTASGDAEALRERLMGGESWEAAVSGDAMVSRDVISVTDKAIFLSGGAFDVGPLAPMKSLDIGQVSHVLELASDDFAVGLKSERVEERITPYDEVSADVRVLLKQQKERQNLEAFERSLRDKAKVEIYDEALFARTAPGASKDLAPKAPESGDAVSAATEDVSGDKTSQ
ncbi:SurA N-terminal domain-containing protein [uncultured Fretibacterium sp.]|uniref:peptidylprolyl isomerase n=1 Tax=uncultured Fretibacterium sp. TaxID=1678694 RepID=UPI002620E794|nr:SurA N-terminal domain-containing protein [uncultured Fretibacterium sp.]